MLLFSTKKNILYREVMVGEGVFETLQPHQICI